MSTYLQQKYRDLHPYPDKYNTGCDLTAITTTVSSAGTYNGIVYGTTATTRRSLDFQYSANQNLGATILIENTSFPDGLQDLNLSLFPRTITFRNCYFGGRYTTIAGNGLTQIFEDCSFGYFSGSDSTFYNCQFGNDEVAGDGLNPYRNIILYDCFILNITGGIGEDETHCDGIQIFGRTVDNDNIHLYNCRFEVPAFPKDGQAAYSNACLMLSIEVTNASNVSFEDCVINGGGYSIYAEKNEGLTFSNILFKNIGIGHAHRYGNIYNESTIDPVIQFENLYDTNKLMVSSYKEDVSNNKIIRVSNDTLSARTLYVISDLGTQTFTIPACFNSAALFQAPITQYYEYSDYPFDLPINIGNVDWFVCYDTAPTESNQIRFVNFTESEIESPISVTITKANIGMIRRRNLIMAIKNKEPFYTPLNYLKSTGAQIIDTGILASSGLKIECELETIGTQFSLLFGGHGTSANANAARFTMSKTNSMYNTQSHVLVSAIVSGIKYSIVKENNLTYIDGVLSTTATSGTFISVNPIGIFGTYTGVSYKASNERHTQKVWKFKITDIATNTVLKDFIPVLDGSNVPCMYDKISKTFHYNQGTGSFLYG